MTLSRRGLLVDGALAATLMPASLASAATAQGAPLRIFEHVDGLMETPDLAPGEIAAVLGRRTPLDGGGALWWIRHSGIADNAICLPLANGLFACLQHLPRHDLRQAGGFADTDGATTGAALVALTRHLIEGGGGTLEIAEPIMCDNIVFPEIPLTAPVTFEMTGSGRVTPSDPRPGVFMWDFPAISMVISPRFRNIELSGLPPERMACNGIRIGASNRLRVENCFGRFIDGCAWQIEGPNNARIEIRTYECGNAEGLFAQQIVTSADRNKLPNDLVLQGTSERDIHGIKIVGGAIIREGSAIKLHGSPRTRHALRLHRCNAFDLTVYASSPWTEDGFIHITDHLGDPDNPDVTSSKVGKNTRGRLRIATMFNVRFAGQGRKSWCLVDLQTPASYIALAGDIMAQAAPVQAGADFRYFRIAGPGNPGVTVDYDDLRFAGNIDTARRLQDDRTPETIAKGRSHPMQGANTTARFTETDISGGRLDCTGIAHAVLALSEPAMLETLALGVDQACTLVVTGKSLTVRASPGLRTRDNHDAELPRGGAISFLRAGAGAVLEIGRNV